MLDKARLAKVLAMTTSPNDSEALAAARKANEIIKGENLRWEDVLAGGGPTVNISVQRTPTPAWEYKAEENWVAPHLRDKVMIDLMFRTMYAQPRTGNDEFWEFMDSIHHQWQQRGSLTQRQYQALMRSYTRVRKPAGAA